MTDIRRRRCQLHGLYPRCPACEANIEKPHGEFPIWDCPIGTAEWLRRAAKFYDSMGSDSAVSFVEWVCVDMREAPKKAQ